MLGDALSRHTNYHRMSWLVIGLLVPWLIEIQPRLRLDLAPWDYAAYALLLVGAGLGAQRNVPGVVYIIYGALGAMAFVTLVLPDRSLMWMAVSAGGWIDEGYYVRRACVLMGGTIVLCRLLALVRPRLDLRRLRKQETHCAACGYPLYGLSEQRCPECGTAFAHAVPIRPPAERN